MNIDIIAAIGEDNSLGRGGDLCWKISEDLKYFKELTLGGVVIMGRKTWESLPIKPLPGRRNIIITRNKNYQTQGGEIFGSLEEAFKTLEKEGLEKVYVIGGGEIYRQSIGRASTLHLTKIYQRCPEADTFFPEYLNEDWTLYANSSPREENGLKFKFQTWIRNGNNY